MPSRPWYRKFPADYAAKTAHLTQGEDGAYSLLLDWQYANSRPLPDRIATLFRIGKASNRREKQNVRNVVEEFFEEIDGGLWNPRAYQELSKNAAARERMAKAGRKGAEKRWGTPKGTPAKSAWGIDGTRARPDPDRSLNTGVDLPRLNLNPDARASDCLTPEQRAEAERMQAELENRRAQFGVAAGGGLRPVSSVEVEIKPGNSDPGNPVGDEE